MNSNRPEVDDEKRRSHYESLAKRYALDARMMRCRAAIHVENKDDIVFWGNVLNHFLPDEKFLFIAGSRNEYGRETFGCSQCLKYRDFLNDKFLIGIDSDYRLLLGESNIDAKHYILQTYTYSFENHHCFADGLSDVCERVAGMKNHVFDFRLFLRHYSHVIYEAFMWHLYFMHVDHEVFPRIEFTRIIDLANSKSFPDIHENGERVLDEIRMKVSRKLRYLVRHYPEVDLKPIRQKYEQIGLTRETAYLYVRGHNIYDMVLKLCRIVSFILVKRKRRKHPSASNISAIYKGGNSADEQLRQNICYGAYVPILELEKDIRQLFM